MPATPPIEPLAVEVSGGQLAAARFGPSSPELPIVVAVHGITSHSRAWSAVSRALAGRATIVAPDLRGRGRSNELPGPYGVATHAADVLALVDSLGVERALIVGHSLGAYIAARFAVDYPLRVHSLVLVDGGLTIPGSEAVDPQEFADAFLGPAIARLRMRFPTGEAYRDWWRAHPAIAGSDIAEDDLNAYADYDLVGTEPELHSSVSEEAMRADAGEFHEIGRPAHQLDVRAKLLCAPRGLVNDPHPMQPLDLAHAWAAEKPDQREAALVDDVNHYTITLGARGAAAVSDAIATSLPAEIRS